jgi:hypothetical protein
MYHERQLYCCNGAEVFLIDIDQARATPTARLWSWTSADSPDIAANHKRWFFGIDECKPVLDGTALLITSSWEPGGVALIRIADKNCLFYAEGANAHSAEIIDGRYVAAACSLRGEYLRLFDLQAACTLGASPVFEMPLISGHGAVWDGRRSVLWAQGGDSLIKLALIRSASPSLELLQQWTLPCKAAHDLFPWSPDRLAITHESGVCIFDIASDVIAPLAGLKKTAHVKSISIHPDTGICAYTQGEPVFTRSVHLLDGQSIKLPPMDLYKCRWNAFNSFSYQDHFSTHSIETFK